MSWNGNDDISAILDQNFDEANFLVFTFPSQNLTQKMRNILTDSCPKWVGIVPDGGD